MQLDHRWLKGKGEPHGVIIRDQLPWVSFWSDVLVAWFWVLRRSMMKKGHRCINEEVMEF